MPGPSQRQTLVSVDLDDLGCYHAIHGIHGIHGSLAPPRSLALTQWLPRFLSLFAALDVRATFFVIGRDLEEDLAGGGEGASVLRDALAAGHELASHSYGHAYDLSRWSLDAASADLRKADALLREVGAVPEGFRAPGYTHSATLMRAVASLGYRYDSSVLPSVPYYAAKVSVLSWMALHGRRSASMMRGAASFVGPDEPYARADVPLVELPMGVSPWTRAPLIGTSLLAGPRWLRPMLRRAALARDYFHLELHAIDLADAAADQLAGVLTAAQPDLLVDGETKAARLRALLEARGPTTLLRDAARAFVERP